MQEASDRHGNQHPCATYNKTCPSGESLYVKKLKDYERKRLKHYQRERASTLCTRLCARRWQAWNQRQKTGKHDRVAAWVQSNRWEEQRNGDHPGPNRQESARAREEVRKHRGKRRPPRTKRDRQEETAERRQTRGDKRPRQTREVTDKRRDRRAGQTPRDRQEPDTSR